MQTFQPHFVIPTMLIGTLDFYHITLLLVTMTLVGDHKASPKQNLLASFSHRHFSRDEIWYCAEEILVEHPDISLG